MERITPPPPSAEWRKSARFGFALIIGVFGFGGAWAALAPLDSAAIAPGLVAVESNRKVVQHLEGGIIAEINVREGSRVGEGDVLFRLDSTAARTNAETLRNQLAAGLAQEARLIAERDGLEDLQFPQEVNSRQTHPVVEAAMADQRASFVERKRTLQGQVAVLEARIRQFHQEIAALRSDHQAILSQVRWIDGELTGIRSLVARQLAPIQRQTGLERDRAKLEGDGIRTLSNIAKAEQMIAETDLQIAQVRMEFRRQVATDLLDIRQRLAESRERLTAAEAILNRVEIRAPQAGVVQNLKVFTIGAVIRPADALLEIVPLDDTLVIRAQVSPNDMDKVRAGLEAEVRFPAFHQARTPIMSGRVSSVSYDRLTDEATRTAYFAAEVRVDKTGLPVEIRDALVAGMPADVIITTGERTALQYLFNPLTDRFRRVMRED